MRVGSSPTQTTKNKFGRLKNYLYFCVMVTFKDIEFRPHSTGEGLHGMIFFPGGYGLSVVRFKYPYSNRYLSYTDDKTWEVAIIKGTKDQWEICYETQITNDVLTYQTEEDINKIIKHIKRLYNGENN